jgi:class 3 adenylate cyclase
MGEHDGKGRSQDCVGTTNMSEAQSLTRGAVTFLDVLGWGGIWTRDNAYDAVARLRGLLRLAENVAARWAVAEPNPEARGARTEIKSISDTIVLQTAGDPEPTLRLHADICTQLICRSIEDRLPLRGATAYGEFLPGRDRDTIVVGPAVDEAASWHEAADWIGVILAPSGVLAWGGGQDSKWIERPAIPLKVGRVPLLRCLDWRSGWKGGAETLRQTFAGVGPLPTSIAAKYMNTLAFFEEGKVPARS